MINYRKEVLKSIKKEFEEYEKIQTSRTPQEVFNNSYSNSFYTEVNNCFEDMSESTDEDVFQALYEKRGHILDGLYDFYIDSDYASISSYGAIQEMISDYIERHCEYELE